MIDNVLCINLKKESSFGLPRVSIFPNKKWIKHVYCEWSRSHVLRWFAYANKSAGVGCNEPNCIINAPLEIQERAKEVCRAEVK